MSANPLILMLFGKLINPGAEALGCNTTTYGKV